MAAETRLSFFLDETPGAPTEVPLETGTKVQSVPVQTKKRRRSRLSKRSTHAFEWNAIKPQIDEGTKSPWGHELYPQRNRHASFIRATPSSSSALNAKQFGQHNGISAVTNVDAAIPKQNTTLVDVAGRLGHDIPHVALAATNPKFTPCASGQRYSATMLRTLAPKQKGNRVNPTDRDTERRAAMEKFQLNSAQIDLDATYPKILLGSWIVLVSPTYVELYGVQSLRATLAPISRSPQR